MTSPMLATQVRWSTTVGATAVVVLFVASFAAAFGLAAAQDVNVFVAGGVTVVALYPGLAGTFAGRSTSSDAVAAIATLLPSLLFAFYVLMILNTPWGWPGRRAMVMGLGACLLFTGLLFGALLSVTRVARPGGFRRGAAAIGVGVAGAVVVLGPFLIWLLLLSQPHGSPR